MKDSCRLCDGRLVGNQCRWIFGSSGKRKLQIILSHVLGREVTRDGRAEFLCGKCVFQLEKVIQCDVNLSQLQELHDSRVQKIQAEKAHLIQCILHVYRKHNPEPEKSDGESVRAKTPLGSSGAASFDDGAAGLRPDEARSPRESCGSQRMRRCVSLDRLVGKGVFPGRSGLKKWRMGSTLGLDAPAKTFGLRGTRGTSQSTYLDLVHYKGTFPRSGFKRRSASLQSLNRDLDTPETTPRKTKVREPKTFVFRNAAGDDPAGKAQAKMLLRRSARQPSIICDLIRLLRCLGKQTVSVPAGSRIPVLKRFGAGLLPGWNKRVRKEAQWKSLHDLTEEFDDRYMPATAQSEVHRLESVNKLLTEELTRAKSAHEELAKTLEETQNETKALSGRLDESENELQTEKKNSLKRDKTIQGLTQVLKEKEKEIAELCHEIEDRDDALAKARETAHKAQMQKFQGAEEHQTLLMAKQTELIQLQGEHHAKVLEAQKLQRGLERREQELADLQLAKEQLEVELEDLQQQKKKGDKAVNDLNNQLKKLSGEIAERESSLEQQYQELLDQTKRKVHAHEVTIQRLTSSLADKEQQLQEYIDMVRDIEQNKSPAGNDSMLAKLRRRLKEKEKALEQALDERFAAMEEKDNEIHQLQLSLREKERDLERLNNLLAHNEETINSFDSLIKEKDVEVQHLANTLKNLRRAKEDAEDNLNRSLREKDAIISQLRLSLDGKTKDLEELSESVPQSRASDLAERMGRRLKVNEATLAEAVRARERLVADNQGAVEGLLATIDSKDQLIKESAEHYKRMLSERSQEIQELRRQLADRQHQLAAAERQNSTAAQKDSLETAELRLLLDEKDGIINRLLHRGRETENDEEPEYVLELRQTIQIMQEKLDEREAELSRRNSDDSMENIPVSKKTVVALKKELAQKTEALNKALKRENELKMSLAELRSLLSELEGRSEGRAANIESLTATLETKDEIIHALQQRLGQQGYAQGDHAPDQLTGATMDRSPSGLPQRERTLIGGDSQQEVLPKLVALQQEHEALNKALRAEQQLYSSLVRTVKEQDSAQRLHALQLELTAVQLLRQQLEDGVQANEELRDDLERELDRAKAGEGVNVVDPKELESVRHQLEDAQRWNASLQARLGAIQNRGGGVGGANDSRDSLSFVGDQTSYMTFCVGEGHDDGSPQELKQKVLELQDCVGRLQAVNAELQSRLAAFDKADQGPSNEEDRNLAGARPWEQQPAVAEAPPPAKQARRRQEKASQTDGLHGQLLRDESVDSGLGRSREDAQCTRSGKCLLSDSGAASLLHLREEVGRPTDENAQVRALLEEQKSGGRKEEESDHASGEHASGDHASGDSGDGQPRNLQAQAKSENQKAAKDGPAPVATEENAPPQADRRSKISKHKACARSRLPVPVRPRAQADAADSQPSASSSSSCGRSQDSGFSAAHTPDDPQAHSALFSQLELLHQECQEKEALIKELGEQLADREELRARLRDEERLNERYAEALRAAESTVAYLTACSLDSRGGPDLQKVPQEKEDLNEQLSQLSTSAEEPALSPGSQEKRAQIRDPRSKIATANGASSEQRGGSRGLRTSNSTQTPSESLPENRSRDRDQSSNGEMSKVLAGCLRSTQSVVASLAAACANSSSFTKPDLQEHLDDLQKALERRQELERLTPASEELLNSDLLGDLRTLRKTLDRHSQRICELQAALREETGRRQESEARAVPPDPKALAPGVQAQLETLHKALREKKKACKNLEEKLATAQSAPAQKDMEAGLGASLPTQEQVHFSSTEHLDSASSTPYPSSPTLSSAKISLKSLQAYEDYGLSEEPPLLQAQVRELKVQLEGQTKLVRQMQSLLRRSPGDQEPGYQSTDPDGTRGHLPRPSREQMREKEGDGDVRASRSETGEAERTRSAKEQLQHARSRSASPASLDSLVQSQARELSQLRQQIKESRRLGGLQRRQLAELRRALQELLRTGPVDRYLSQALKEQLDKSLTILDRLEGRLDKGDIHQDNEDGAALELSRRMAKELQEKNRLIQTLQSQVRGQSPGSPHSSQSDRSSCHGSPPTQGERTEVAGASAEQEASSRLSGSQGQNGVLGERLRDSERPNASLRSELDLHPSVMAQHPAPKNNRALGSAAKASAEARTVNSELLAEHLEEIRALRRRLEESISTNERLREQLERRLAEAEADKDTAATNIFIHGNEDQAELVKEVRFLWAQNQALKEQLDPESKGTRLRENPAGRSAKLEQDRKESDLLRQEKAKLREKLELSGQENARLVQTLRAGEDQLRSLQCEVKLQQQQVKDSQRLLQVLRLELQVRDNMQTPAHAPRVSDAAGVGSDTSEMRHLRAQLERSIRANDTLRQRLEEQLWRGAARSETININYLLSSPDERSGSPAREDGADGRERRRLDGGESGSSSGESAAGAPSRLVPGHRLWANRDGRHILALVEDYSALRRHISEGRKLSRAMEAHLRLCLNDRKALDEEGAKLLRGDVSTVQQVLDEAARLLKLVWRVSLPAGGDDRQEDLKKEIWRLKNRVSQQDRVLSGAVKRLRTTNRLKEGMERVIIDQLSLTHNVLKKARGNLEEMPVNGQ